MDLESIAWVSRTRNRSVRQRLRHLSYQSSSEEESSSESVSTKSEIKPEAPSVAASENSVPDKPTTDDVSYVIGDPRILRDI
jgi:hypothetical protein